MIENVEQYFEEDKDAFFYSRKLKKNCNKSVHGKSYDRLNKARDEIKMKQPVSLETIIAYVNELFETIGIKRIDYPKPIVKPNDIDYNKIKELFHLEDERDIIWMKFTKKGYLGVVATSNDIGFDFPSSKSAYDKKIEVYDSYERKYKEVWKFSSSGILADKVDDKWDETYVLIFPLEKDSGFCKYNRHQIETAIGNYLISKNVPIIDYYSHNYH